MKYKGLFMGQNANMKPSTASSIVFYDENLEENTS